MAKKSKENAEGTTRDARRGYGDDIFADIFRISPWTRRRGVRRGIDAEQAAKEEASVENNRSGPGAPGTDDGGDELCDTNDAGAETDPKDGASREAGEKDGTGIAADVAEPYTWLTRAVLSGAEAGRAALKEEAAPPGAGNGEIDEPPSGGTAPDLGEGEMAPEDKPGTERPTEVKAPATKRATAARTPRPKSKAKTPPKAEAPENAEDGVPAAAASLEAKAPPKRETAGITGPAADERPRTTEIPVEDLANGLINVLGDGLGHAIDVGSSALRGGISGARLGVQSVASGLNAGRRMAGALASKIRGKLRKGGGKGGRKAAKEAGSPTGKAVEAS